MRFAPQDPDGIKNYTINIEEWLDGDTISTATWTVPTGITKDSDTKTDTTFTIWLSGGTDGQDYDLVCHVVTAAGIEEDFSITVPVRESTALNVYGNISDIEALVAQYTSSGEFSSSTRPTLAQVQSFINRISALLNVMLAGQGFAIPVTQADAKLALDEFVIQEVVQLCHGANRAGAFAPGSERLRNRTPFQIITAEAAGFIEKHADGLEALGATRTRGLTHGLSCRTQDDGGDTIVPMFQRKMMGHEVIDWDTA